MFILTMIFSVIFIVAIVINLIADEYDDAKVITCVFSWFSGIVLFILIIAIPMNRFGNLDSIKEFEAFQETLDIQRDVASEYETAILTGKVITWNTSLARWKNQNIWYRCDWWIHDDIMDLQPIK